MAANSGRIINYALRPAKSIERKMLRDAFQRLYQFDRTDEYQYIGFGAKYFTDFSLFHTSLNISKMISIEVDTNNKARYEFNKPFNCIEMMFGKSSAVMHKLPLNNRSICWFDYDGKFSDEMLSDIGSLVEKLPSGSVIALSYNSKPYSRIELNEEYGGNEQFLFKRKYQELLGTSLFPNDFKEQGMSSWSNHSKMIRKALNSHLASCLSSRNVGLDAEEKISFKQIFYFDYKDGVEMSTLVFLIHSENDRSKFSDCKFEELFFYREGEEPFNIEVPNLTYKEIKTLHENMPIPAKGVDASIKKVVEDKDIELFAQYYRYFPNYSEVQVL